MLRSRHQKHWRPTSMLGGPAGEEPDGVRVWAHLFDSPLGEAVLIPAGWYDGDGDLRHGPRADGRYGRLGRP